MRVLTDQEFAAFKEAVAPSVAEWLAHPVTMVMYNAIRRISDEAASSANASAPEAALSIVGANRMKEAALSCILDPQIVLSTPKQIEALEATYKPKKETSNVRS